MPATTPPRRSLLLSVALLSTLVLLVAGLYLRDRPTAGSVLPGSSSASSTPTSGPTPSPSPPAKAGHAPSATPDGAPRGWDRLYTENFDSPVPLGGFTHQDGADWYLEEDNPYASTLRSYPDGWGTTKNRSLNYASKTTDVVEEELGATGVFRLHGYTPTTGEVKRPLGGSFFPVLHPEVDTKEEQIGQTYGRYSVRFRTTGGYRPDETGGYPEGSKTGRFGTAFLLWPVSDNWAEGEIDYPEMPWGAKIAGYVHEIGDPANNSDQFTSHMSTEVGWRTATVEWYPGVLAFYLDGILISKVTENVPDTAFRWGFQSGGTMGVPAADIEGYLLIDWVTIDAYRGAVAPD